MSYTFRVLFSGLCAFVPNKPFEQEDGPPLEVTVLLQNLLRPASLVGSPDGDALDPHFPSLEFDLADLHPLSPRKPDLRREDNGKGACLLFGEDISFDLALPEGVERKLSIPATKQPETDLKQSTPENQDSLFWLARLEKAAPDQFVDPKLLDGPLLGGEKLVLARLKLDHGFLRVSRLSERVCSFIPVDGVEPYEQQIATELALDIDGVEGPTSIVLRAPDGLERVLMLSPVRRSRLLEIRIQNREIDDLLGIPRSLLPERELADFQVHYNLVSSADQIQKTRRRFPKQPGQPLSPNGGPSLKNPSLCPPTGLLVKPAAA